MLSANFDLDSLCLPIHPVSYLTAKSEPATPDTAIPWTITCIRRPGLSVVWHAAIACRHWRHTTGLDSPQTYGQLGQSAPDDTPLAPAGRRTTPRRRHPKSTHGNQIYTLCYKQCCRNSRILLTEPMFAFPQVQLYVISNYLNSIILLFASRPFVD